MNKFEKFIMVIKRTAGTMGVMLLLCWLLFLVGFELIASVVPDEPLPSLPETPPAEEPEPEYAPPIDEARPNCILMRDGSYVCDRSEGDL